MTATGTDSQPEMPGAVGYYHCYCAGLLVIFAVLLPVLIWQATSLQSPFGNPWDGFPAGMGEVFRQQHEQEAFNARLVGFSICGFLSLALGTTFFLPRTPGAWVYHTVIICLGLGGWLLPFSVLLLINWFQPKTQAYFGRGPAASGAPGT